MSPVTDRQLSVSGTCRDIRHSWKSVGDNVLIEQQGQVRHFSRALECSRCETVRVDEYKISRVSIARVRTRYFYPQDYRIPGGVKVADIRFLLFRNAPMVAVEESA
jgi:hypothetical protein